MAAGNPNQTFCPDTEVCLEWDEEVGCYRLTTNYGNDKLVKPAPNKVTGEVVYVGNTCFLRLYVNGVLCDSVNMASILDKLPDTTVVLGFDASNCTIDVTINGTQASLDISSILAQSALNYNSSNHSLTQQIKGQDQVPTALNVGSLDLKVANGVCSVCYTNERGQTNELPLPSTSYVIDEDACTLTVTDSKTGSPLVVPLGAGATDLCIELDANQDLCFTFKGTTICKVVMPNFVQSVTLDNTSCVTKVAYWDGSVEELDYLAPINLEKTAAGGFMFTFKGQTCAMNPPSLTPDPNNPAQYIWDNGYGQTQVVNVNEMDLDINNVTFSGSVINFTAEDGSSIPVDICQIVALNCNAGLTLNPDGSMTFVDNAGTPTTIPAAATSSVVANAAGVGGGVGTATVTMSDGSTKDNVVCGVQSTVADDPSGNYGTVTQNDGTTCRFLKTITLRDCNGAQLGDTAQVVSVGDVSCQSPGCLTICNTKVAIRRFFNRMVWNAANAVSFTGANELGDTLEAPTCLSITVPDCIGNGTGITFHMTTEMNHRDHEGGTMAVNNEISIDGGVTWNPVQLGGYAFGAPNPNNQTDVENGGTVTLRVNAGDVLDVKMRSGIVIFNTFVGEVTINQMEIDYHFDALTCAVDEV